MAPAPPLADLLRDVVFLRPPRASPHQRCELPCFSPLPPPRSASSSRRARPCRLALEVTMVGTPLTSPLVPFPPLSHAGPERAAASRLPGLAASPTSRSPPNRLRRRPLGSPTRRPHALAAAGNRCRLRSPWPWHPSAPGAGARRRRLLCARAHIQRGLAVCHWPMEPVP